MTDIWVSVAFLKGDEYDEISELGVQELADYLAQWDFGDETDMAGPRSGAPWGSSDRTYDVSVGGLDYVLAVNHPLGYASLNRRPLAEPRYWIVYGPDGSVWADDIQADSEQEALESYNETVDVDDPEVPAYAVRYL